MRPSDKTNPPDLFDTGPLFFGVSLASVPEAIWHCFHHLIILITYVTLVTMAGHYLVQVTTEPISLRRERVIFFNNATYELANPLDTDKWLSITEENVDLPPSLELILHRRCL